MKRARVGNNFLFLPISAPPSAELRVRLYPASDVEKADFGDGTEYIVAVEGPGGLRLAALNSNLDVVGGDIPRDVVDALTFLLSGLGWYE